MAEERKKSPKKKDIQKSTKKDTKGKSKVSKTKPVSKVKKEDIIKSIESKKIVTNENKKVKKKVEITKCLKTVWKVVFWVIFAALLISWITDYIRVANKHKPVFCVVDKIEDRKTGSVDKCYGLGYKVYTYDVNGYTKGMTFGTYFMKDVTNEKN